MGDPKKIRRKYSGPGHPWQRKRIESEKILLKEYGLKNKKEIWRSESLLKNFASQAKKLIAVKTSQGDKEKKQLFQRLEKLGLLQQGAVLENVLELTLKDILNRRLQTVLYKKGFARTIEQARQFITHQHINVAGRIVTAPAYLVSIEEEPIIKFLASSSLANENHPERAIEEAAKKPAAESKEKKRAERKRR